MEIVASHEQARPMKKKYAKDTKMYTTVYTMYIVHNVHVHVHLLLLNAIPHSNVIAEYMV